MLLYVQTYVQLWSYLALFFWEWEMIQTKVVEKIKSRVLYSVTCFRKSCRLWDNVEKFCRTGQVTVDQLRKRIACWITKATDTHS